MDRLYRFWVKNLQLFVGQRVVWHLPHDPKRNSDELGGIITAIHKRTATVNECRAGISIWENPPGEFFTGRVFSVPHHQLDAPYWLTEYYGKDGRPLPKYRRKEQKRVARSRK